MQKLLKIRKVDKKKKSITRKEQIIALLKQVHTLEANGAPLNHLIQQQIHEEDIKPGSTSKGSYTFYHGTPYTQIWYFCLFGVWARHYRGFFTFACLVYGLNVFVFCTKTREKIILVFQNLYHFRL